ncbi:MAG: glycosyltransferase [Gemmatimonadota bacterium]|nr:glycosyltransferase [Gemmatimonadota bacterium]
MTHPLLLGLAALTLLGWVGLVVQLGLGRRHMQQLADVPLPDGRTLPRMSVIVTALNEERSIEQALRSLLAQQYPDFEVVVVNDRSTDATGAILDRMAMGEPRLRVVHNRELPAGWLGKNHAMQRGAQMATGEWLLFTDADVIFAPTSLARAAGHTVREKLDHLAVAPEITAPGPLVGMFVGTFSIFFSVYARPWKVHDPRSRAHIGIGAFNLVRAEAYQRLGGHAPIRMRPDDDMKLGKLIKQAGLRQRFLVGREMVRVEWYPSLGEVARGLEKNSFAGMEYSVARLVAATFAMLAFNLWPFVAVFATAGVTRMVYAATVLLILAVCGAGVREGGGKPWYALGFPFAASFFLYVIWRSTLKALRNDGIDWRGTHYPLAQLKANRV